MKKRIHRNTSDVAKGDQFEVETNLTLVDAGDLTDVVLTHEVTKNDAKFVEATCTWYGLGALGVAAIQDAMSKADLAPGKEPVKGFKALVKQWRKITKALGHLNDAGEALDGVD